VQRHLRAVERDRQLVAVRLQPRQQPVDGGEAGADGGQPLEALAQAAAMTGTAGSLRDLRVAEVVRLDMKVENERSQRSARALLSLSNTKPDHGPCWVSRPPSKP
jgi:hypothetical protein